MNKSLVLYIVATLCCCMTTAAPADLRGIEQIDRPALITTKYVLSPSDEFIITRISNAVSSLLVEYNSIAEGGLHIYENALHQCLDIFPGKEPTFIWDKYERYNQRKYVTVSVIKDEFLTQLNLVISSARHDFRMRSNMFIKNLDEGANEANARASVDELANALIPMEQAFKEKFSHFLVERFPTEIETFFMDWVLKASWTDFQHEHGADIADVDWDKPRAVINGVVYDRDNVQRECESKFLDTVQDIKNQMQEYIASSMPDGSSIIRNKLMNEFARGDAAVSGA